MTERCWNKGMVRNMMHRTERKRRARFGRWQLEQVGDEHDLTVGAGRGLLHGHGEVVRSAVHTRSHDVYVNGRRFGEPRRGCMCAYVQRTK